MVGEDDEIWDFAVTASVSLLTQIDEALRAEGIVVGLPASE